jgi:surfeit locus 1 family protein
MGASIATACALAILISLGVWQLHRLHWKEAILARIDAAELAPPIPLSGATPALFTRVVAQGVLRGDRVALYGAEVRGTHMGAQAIQLLDRKGLAPLLVMLGWVPTDAGKPVPRAGSAEVTGYIRLAERPTWLSAPDDLEGLRFYTLDPAAIGAALGAPDAAPFTLVSLGKGDSLPRPVNNHLNYALTWFGLAGALVAVFTAWSLKVSAAART